MRVTIRDTFRERAMGLEIVELTLEVERTFGIEIPERELEHLRTVGDWSACLRAVLPGDLDGTAATTPGAPVAISDAELWQRLRSIVAEASGVSPECVVPSARLIEDLGMG
jgi:acyl carrier protein